MVRVLSYNILVGAADRVNQVERMIRSVDPDIVGLVEATDPYVVVELAQRLGMRYVMSGAALHKEGEQLALLSRLPIVNSQVHKQPSVLTMPMLEVTVEEPDGGHVTAFVIHLSAAFNQGRAGDHVRRREVSALIRLMSAKRGEPHLLMGDFNNLAPGDHFRASALLRYLVVMDRQRRLDPEAAKGHPYLNFVVPPALRLFNPLLRVIAYSKPLRALFDRAASLYAPRGSIAMLRSAGYVDCFRALNPSADGFTCPAAAPAGRIDFIFASPELAASLASCRAVVAGDGVSGAEASDHLPVMADFGETARISRPSGIEIEDRVEIGQAQ